ncbi:ubiquinone anaerobic biosynthesis accessory factor UbiT [Microbulbifer harenosus]|nr:MULTISPECIES: SCP2 sterol-binding domain-containing protein [Microbulbifer]QIL90584.1 SCP2 domain-containing protein [Microbulbifer sp. SH-1]
MHSNVLRTGFRLGVTVAKRLPSRPLELAAVTMLNRQLAEELIAGEFDFLDGRQLDIAVTDLGLQLRIGKRAASLVALPRAKPECRADATIAACAADFLAIVSGREDPDTLFFQRRLTISGDTELGLTAKNRLDAIDRGRIPPALQRAIRAMAESLAPRVA